MGGHTPRGVAECPELVTWTRVMGLRLRQRGGLLASRRGARVTSSGPDLALLPPFGSPRTPQQGRRQGTPGAIQTGSLPGRRGQGAGGAESLVANSQTQDVLSLSHKPKRKFSSVYLIVKSRGPWKRCRATYTNPDTERELLLSRRPRLETNFLLLLLLCSGKYGNVNE